MIRSSSRFESDVIDQLSTRGTLCEKDGNSPSSSPRFCTDIDGRLSGPFAESNSHKSTAHQIAERSEVDEYEVLFEKLKRVAGTMVVRPDRKIFKCGIIDNLAMYFVYGDLLSADSALSKEPVAGRPVGDLLVKLVKMFDKSRHNVAILTGCLVCVYLKIARRSQIKADHPRARLLLADFVRVVVGRYLREVLDDAVWSEWFGDGDVTFHWFCFVATLFAPNGNFVAAGECGRVVDVVVEYLRNVENCEYSCQFEHKPPVKKLRPTFEGCTFKTKGKTSRRPEVYPKKRKTTPRERKY